MTKIKAGKVLLAEPFMADPHFKRAVILLAEHRLDGSIGFILNKTIGRNINELLADFPDFEAEVFYGGPVATDTLHFVHCVGGLLEDSIPISRGLWWGGDFNKLKFLIEQNLVDANQIRFFVGYSGWTEGQLLEEMETGSWVIGDGDSNYVFNTRPKKLWSEAMKQQGDTFEIISGISENVNWN
jgi:putative transcriptional regulator